jgi:hypothetical protein
MKRSMAAKFRYTDEPLGDLRVVEDFLPPAERLVFREDTTKVTIALSKSSIDSLQARGEEAPDSVSEDDSKTPGSLRGAAARQPWRPFTCRQVTKPSS